MLPSHQFSCPEYETLTNTNDHWPIQYAVIFGTFSYKSYDWITCLCLLAGKYYFRETESSRGRVKGKGMSKGTLRNIHLAVQKIKQRILKNYGNLTSDSTKIQLTNTAINVQNMLFSTIRCPLALLRFVAWARVVSQWYGWKKRIHHINILKKSKWRPVSKRKVLEVAPFILRERSHLFITISFWYLLECHLWTAI